MKLNIISNDWHPSSDKGGSEKSLFEVLTNLKKLGNEIQLGYTIEGNLLDEYKTNGIELKKIIRSYIPNKYNPLGFIQLILSAIKFKVKKNSIVYINSFYDAPLAVIIKLIYNIPICCHLRIPPAISRQFLLALKYIDSFIVANEKMKNLYAEYGIPENKFTIIPNGFIFKEMPIKKKIGYNTIFKIVYLGRIAEEKGIGELIKAYQIVNQKYSNCELHITGPVISQANILFKEKLKKLINQLSLDHKIFLNEPIREPCAYLSKFHLCIFPSLVDEAFGRIIVESISAGTPVICHNVGSVAEIMNDPEHEWIYNTSEELIHMILRLIENPSSYKLNDRYEHIKKNYDINNIAESINNHLLKTLNEFQFGLNP